MKYKFFLFSSLLVLLFALIFTVCFLGTTQQVLQFNKRIETLDTSLQKTVRVAETEILSAFANKNLNLQVGNIVMYLDAKNGGNAEITFFDLGDDKIRFVAFFDLTNKELKKITVFHNDSKIIAVPLNFGDWNVDSTEAVAAAMNLFIGEGNSKFDMVVVSTTLTLDSRELWIIRIIDGTEESSFNVKVDPYTGEVVT